MNAPKICEFGQAWWAEIRKKVRNAAVFLDPVACECLHWNGGAPSILDAGASCLKELSTFETVPRQAKKAVFVFSTAVCGTNLKILKHLIKSSKLEYCVIVTAAHASVHHLLQWGGGRENQEVEAFDKIEEDVLTWMGNLNYTVEIFNYPFITTHPMKDLILIPSARPVEPLSPSDLPHINEQLMMFHKQADAMTVRSINDLTFASLPLESQGQIRQLIHNMNQILQHINGKEEIFTVGSFSRIVGTELEALNAAKTRRKTATNRISVIFVDRILDLASTTKFSSGCLFDRFVHTLERLHEHSSDVAFSMTGKPVGELTVAPGCLAPQSNWNEGWSRMDTLFRDNIQSATENVSIELNEARDEEDQPMANIIERCENDWDFIEKFTHLYQVGKAILESEKSRTSIVVDNLERIQLSLAESLDDDGAPSPLIQILQLIKSRKDTKLSLDDILVLLIHIYSLAGDQNESPFTVDLEDRLKGLLAENLVAEGDNLSDSLQEFVGAPVDEVRAHRAAQKIMQQLHYMNTARCHMKRYRKLFQRRNPAMPLECVGILQQLIDDIFDPSVVDNPDVEHKSGSLKDLLKTGFSLFVNVRKPKPCDNPTILLYVCGGIRPDEVKMVRELFRQKSPAHNVLIASSHLVSSHDALHNLLKK